MRCDLCFENIWIIHIDLVLVLGWRLLGLLRVVVMSHYVHSSNILVICCQSRNSRPNCSTVGRVFYISSTTGCNTNSSTRWFIDRPRCNRTCTGACCWSSSIWFCCSSCSFFYLMEFFYELCKKNICLAIIINISIPFTPIEMHIHEK